MSDEKKVSRREFVGDAAKLAAAVAVAPTIVPRHVLGRGYRAPSDTFNVAMVGIGGMGMSNMNALLAAGENVVAICDVDFAYVERSLSGRLRPRPNRRPEDEAEAKRLYDSYMKAAKHDDFRRMLEKQKDVDGVVVATPDHMHAQVAYHAMKAGKHVYVQKPLTWSVHEARLLARTARETGVTSQMGNQGHSMEGTHRIVELIRAGVIGPVREVHVWTDRPLRYWAQGIPSPYPRPATTPAGTPATGPGIVGYTPAAAAQLGGRPTTPNASAPNATPPAPEWESPFPAARTPAPPRWSMGTVDQAIRKAMDENPHTVPAGLDWNLFLGPAQDIPYHPVFHPFSWRGWTDFGVSAIGDMGAHLIDQPFWALDLDYPTSVVSVSTPWGTPSGNPGSYPLAMMTEYEFAARGGQPPVKLFWYDGGFSPVAAAEIPRPAGDGGGGIFIGDKGYLTYETYGNNPKVFPESLTAAADAVPKTLPRIETSHEANWAQSAKNKKQASSPFDYAAKLTETMLLGVVALRAGQRTKIQYDGANMRVTNLPDINAWLTRAYRPGWEL